VILAIDPGPDCSGWVLYDEHARRVERCGDDTDNSTLEWEVHVHALTGQPTVCEWVENYGKSPGQSVFRTCKQIGRFEHIGEQSTFQELTRREIKLHLCGTMRSGDANVRAALVDKFGGSRAAAVGTKKTPGPLYNVKGHASAALAVAVTWAETRNG
jgi:hypothetical protein